MKAIAYNITTEEKEALILANHKKHEITFIAQKLSPETAALASGKEILLVFPGNAVTAEVIPFLADAGIRYLAVSVTDTANIHKQSAHQYGLKIANIPETVLAGWAGNKAVAAMEQLVKNIDLWAAGKCVGKACCCASNCAKVVPQSDTL